MRQIVALAEYSRQSLQFCGAKRASRMTTPERGILHFYTDQQEFYKRSPARSSCASWARPRNTVSADEVIRTSRPCRRMRGARSSAAILRPATSRATCICFTTALAACAAAAGVDFSLWHDSDPLAAGRRKSNWRGMHRCAGAPPQRICGCRGGGHGQLFRALLRPLGMRLMLYPGKGYSATYPILDPASAPTVSLTDDGHASWCFRAWDRACAWRVRAS